MGYRIPGPSIRLLMLGALAVAATLATTVALSDQNMYTTGTFSGVKVNGGTATLTKQGKTFTIELSPDFKVPDAPAPHWQIVDGDGNTYLLQRLVIKEDKFHKSITLPSYIRSVAKVQIWCAWAEVLLGEASFNTVVR
jgi:hypothetical protein